MDIDESSEPASLLVRLDSDDRIVRIPVSQVDVENSMDDEIVAMVPGGSLVASSVPDRADAGQAPAERVPPDVVPPDTGHHRTITLAEEELEIEKHETVQGRVVVSKHVETFTHDQPVELAHDEVDVERVPVGRDVDEVPRIREEGATTIVPVIEEVLVVEKRLRLVEEVRITRRQVRQQTSVREDLRREVVDITTEEPDEGEQR
jgi:uncharacterized protein (TIGR02271 family)